MSEKQQKKRDGDQIHDGVKMDKEKQVVTPETATTSKNNSIKPETQKKKE